MRSKHLVAILVLLVLALPASPAHAGGVVSVCDEAHLRAALAGGGMVSFGCNGTITLEAQITIATDTTIDASGQNITLSGNNAVRVLNVNPGVTLNLNRLTVANGSAWHFGGGIYNRGTLILRNSTLYHNIADSGAGITNSGVLTVSNSTLSDNIASQGGGGIYSSAGTLTVSNSTFSGNRSDGLGAGIVTERSTAMVSNCTFSGNRASWVATTIASTSGSLVLRNTIIVNSQELRNCGGFITDGGGNLSYPGTTCPGINANPMLGPLQNNGGPTETMAPGPGSAAIDAGIDAICSATPVNNLDQRGIARPQGMHCDIGAVEQELYPSLPSRMWLPTIRAR